MNADEQSDRYWVGFNVVRGIGPVRLRALIDYFGDVERAWYASYQELRSAGLDRRSLENLLAARSALDLDREWERIAAAGAHVLTWNSSGYPPLLREIPD
ncbi:MAG: DNA-protecting protein DprA, partial [Chloroflexi bacterium]